jgi:glycosyltransferase involved in cell wall biosynthesis
MKTIKNVAIHFVHSASTPHNNYFLDNLASLNEVALFRHYLFDTTKVPGRPWKKLNAGLVQEEKIRTGIGIYFDYYLFKQALTDKKSIFFIVGWDYPLLVVLLFIVCMKRRGLIMWDDGPSDEALRQIQKWWIPKQFLKRVLIRQINKTVESYFCTGQKACNDAILLGFEKSKIKSLPFFVKPGSKDIKLRKLHECEGDVMMFLAGGRFIVDKGYDILVKALNDFNSRYTKPWKLVLIGSGPEKNHVVSLVEKFKLNAKIDFVDWAESDLFANYIKTCDVFIAPARFDFFPTTIISALNGGVAVLATDGVGSAKEYIISGKNGLIVPANSVNALSDGLLFLVSDKERLMDIAKCGSKTSNLWPVERGVKSVVNTVNKIVSKCVE